MFSRDPKHYRATPRTISEAFGPYAKFAPPPAKRDKWLTIAGVVLVGAAFGLLIGWRG